MQVGAHRRQLWLTSGVILAGFSFAAAAALAYPGVDLGRYEGPSLPLALRLASGLPIYGAEAALRPPYAFATYGPFFYGLYGLCLRLLGSGSFLPGRLLAFLSTLATVGLVHRRVASEGRPRLAGVAAAALFLSSAAVGPWAAQARSDPPGILCCILAVILADRRPAMAGAAAAGAFFFKPLLIGAGLAVVARRLLSGDRPGLVRFVLGAAVVAALAIGLLAATGNLGYAWNLSQVGRMAWDPGTFPRILAMVAIRPSLWLAATLAVLAFRRDPRSVTSLYLLTSLLSIPGAFHRGAASNHYAEISLALAVAGGTELGRRMAEGGELELAVLRPANAALLITAALFVLPGAFRSWRTPLEQRERQEQIVQVLATVPSSSPIATELGPPTTEGHPVWFDEVFNYADPNVAPHGEWEEVLARKELGALILNSPHQFEGYHPAGPPPAPGEPTLYLPDP